MDIYCILNGNDFILHNNIICAKKYKNIQPHMKMINEVGLLMLLSKSHKSLAKEFKVQVNELLI